MNATLNGQPIELPEISLDDFGWDSSSTHGPLSLVLSLNDSDLLAVGQKLRLYTQESLAVEPDFFEDEYMREVPVPKSERVFVEEPQLIGVYLDDSFWSRETVIAILNLIPKASNQLSARYLIQDFRQLIADGAIVKVEFGAFQR